MAAAMFLSCAKKKTGSFLACCLLVVCISFAQVGPSVPVLCYHGFADDTSAIRGKLTERYTRFEEMLRFLTENGYETSFPEEIQAARARQKNPIIITFDDGRKEQLRAAQMMQKYNMRGIFFVIPTRLFSENNENLTNADLALLNSWGHQIGVHGHAHRSMVESPAETEAVRTIALGIVKGAVPSQLLFPSFAYPFGHYDSSMVDLRRAGYRYLHTVNPGYWDRRATLIPRMLITSDKPAEFFQEYIRKGAEFVPALVPITPDGAWANVVSFRIIGPVSTAGLEIIAVSADRDGYHYSSHTAADVVSVHGDLLLFELRKYVEGFFQATRSVLSYAFVGKRDSLLFYVSNGQANWVEK